MENRAFPCLAAADTGEWTLGFLSRMTALQRSRGSCLWSRTSYVLAIGTQSLTILMIWPRFVMEVGHCLAENRPPVAVSRETYYGKGLSLLMDGYVVLVQQSWGDISVGTALCQNPWIVFLTRFLKVNKYHNS